MEKTKIITAILCCFTVFTTAFAQERDQKFRENISLDSIRLSDPCILADKNTSLYYKTGTG
mgnify:CR=1 FL=1